MLRVVEYLGASLIYFFSSASRSGLFVIRLLNHETNFQDLHAHAVPQSGGRWIHPNYYNLVIALASAADLGQRLGHAYVGLHSTRSRRHNAFSGMAWAGFRFQSDQRVSKRGPVRWELWGLLEFWHTYVCNPCRTWLYGIKSCMTHSDIMLKSTAGGKEYHIARKEPTRSLHESDWSSGGR